MRLAGAKMAGVTILKRVAFVALAATAVAMLATPMSAGSARLVWNASPSAPTGLYVIDHGNWRAGDRVVVLPSLLLAADLAARVILGDGKLLIKRVAASTGDKVCRQQQDVSINDHVVARAKAVGSDGAPLPFWQGCVTLDNEQVFLLGDTAESYDGRYFGITSATEVIGRAVDVVTF